VGTRISVHWPEEGEQFKGQVTKVSEQYCVLYDDGDMLWHSWQGSGALDWQLETAAKEAEGTKQKKKKKKKKSAVEPTKGEKSTSGPSGAVTNKNTQKRGHEQTRQVKVPSSDQLFEQNESLKHCKQEFIEEDRTDVQQIVSSVAAEAQCTICSDTMKQASTVSGCGHTFCRSCIEDAVRLKGCCPDCLLPVWQRDIRDSRRVAGLLNICTG
jgi:hypothetical protein